MAGSGRDERAWVRGAQAGSVSDLEALFRAHWPRAYRAAYLVVHDGAAAEDIAQEAFLAAVRSLDCFDRKRPFGPWLHRIAVNRAIDWARARSLRPEAGEVETAAPASHARDEAVQIIGGQSRGGNFAAHLVIKARAATDATGLAFTRISFPDTCCRTKG